MIVNSSRRSAKLRFPGMFPQLAAVAIVLALAGGTVQPVFAQEKPAAAVTNNSDDDLLDSLEDDYASEETAAPEITDPLEPANRAVFGFNMVLDTVILKPVAYTYRAVTPEPLRTGITNVINNTYAPVTILNAALQGNRDKVGDTTVRFLLNTTLGIGGLLDVATMAGLPQYYEDFGQTLAVHGVPSGGYIVIPVLGPSSPRHLAGRTVDYLTNPLSWILWDTNAVVSSSPTMANLVTQREANIESIDALQASSPDFYEVAKSAYVQNRQSNINDAAEGKSGAAETTASAGLKVKQNAFTLDEATKDNELSR